MKKLLILFCLFSTFSTVLAQNFEVGHITRAGKKVEGFIKYENWLQNPNTIQFKRTLNDVVEVIDTKNADEFSVHDENYISKKIKIVVSLNTLQDTKDRNTQYISPMVEGDYFLRIFFKTTKTTLFEFIDSKEKSHLFIERDNNFQELFYSSEYHYEGSAMYLKEKKGYISQLRSLFAGCGDAEISDNLPYSKDEISKVCLSYLKCNGDSYLYSQKPISSKEDKISLSLGLAGGHFFNVNNPQNWLIGLSLRINFPRNFRNNYLLIEGNYNNIRDNSDKSIYYYPQPDDDIRVYSFNVIAGKYFGKKNFRPFINAGISLMGKFGGNAVFGAGISWKRMIRLEYRQTTSSMRFQQLLLGYSYEF